MTSAAAARLRLLAVRARAEDRRRRIGWVALAAFLFAVPTGFNQLRATEFSASVQIFPGANPPYPAVFDAAYYRGFLSDPHLHREMRRNAGVPPERYSDASFRATPARTVEVSVADPDQEEAARLVNALAPQIVGATGRELDSKASAEAALLRARLRNEQLTRLERRALRRKLRVVDRLASGPTPRAVLGPAAGPAPPATRADRLVDALPGEFERRPNPLTAGMAGLLLAATLWVLGLALFRPAGTPAPSGAELPPWRVRRPGRPGGARTPALPAWAQSRELPAWTRLPDRMYGWLLGLVAAVFVAIILVLSGPLETFRWDEWNFIAERQGNSVDTYLDPHFEHLSTIPVAVFKALFATVGLEPYWPYKLMAAPLVALLGILVYLYAAPRVGRGWAFVPGVLTTLVGQGAYDIIWPFQIGFNLSVACGLGILLCFDRPGKRSDLIAGALVLIALLSSSVGIAVAVTAVVEVALSRGQRIARGLRIVVVPGVLYLGWWLQYRPDRVSESAAPLDAIQLMLEIGGAGMAALFAVPIGLRLPAALVLIAAIVIGLRRTHGPHRRALLVACSLPISYWALLILGRGSNGEELLLDSRYILPGAVWLACVGAELLRGSTARAPVWVAALVAVATVGATANNVRYVRNAANFDADVRAEPAKAHAAALFLAEQSGPFDPSFKFDDRVIPNAVDPADLAEGFKVWGLPVDEPENTITSSPPAVRAEADRIYLGARGLRPRPAPTPATRPGCRTLTGPSAEVVVPPTGIALRGSGTGPVAVGLRRWSAASLAKSPAPERGWSLLVPGRDEARTPVRAVIDGFRVRLCRL